MPGTRDKTTERRISETQPNLSSAGKRCVSRYTRSLSEIDYAGPQ